MDLVSLSWIRCTHQAKLNSTESCWRQWDSYSCWCRSSPHGFSCAWNCRAICSHKLGKLVYSIFLYWFSQFPKIADALSHTLRMIPFDRRRIKCVRQRLLSVLIQFLRSIDRLRCTSESDWNRGRSFVALIRRVCAAADVSNDVASMQLATDVARCAHWHYITRSLIFFSLRIYFNWTNIFQLRRLKILNREQNSIFVWILLVDQKKKVQSTQNRPINRYFNQENQIDNKYILSCSFVSSVICIEASQLNRMLFKVHQVSESIPFIFPAPREYCPKDAKVNIANRNRGRVLLDGFRSTANLDKIAYCK